MSGKIIIDTNIFIYLTQGDENVIDFIQDKNISVSLYHRIRAFVV